MRPVASTSRMPAQVRVRESVYVCIVLSPVVRRVVRRARGRASPASCRRVMPYAPRPTARSTSRPSVTSASLCTAGRSTCCEGPYLVDAYPRVLGFREMVEDPIRPHVQSWRTQITRVPDLPRTARGGIGTRLPRTREGADVRTGLAAHDTLVREAGR